MPANAPATAAWRTRTCTTRCQPQAWSPMSFLGTRCWVPTAATATSTARTPRGRCAVPPARRLRPQRPRRRRVRHVAGARSLLLAAPLQRVCSYGAYERGANTSTHRERCLLFSHFAAQHSERTRLAGDDAPRHSTPHTQRTARKVPGELAGDDEPRRGADAGHGAGARRRLLQQPFVRRVGAAAGPPPAGDARLLRRRRRALGTHPHAAVKLVACCLSLSDFVCVPQHRDSLADYS